MEITKEKIIEELKEFDWEYVDDQLTKNGRFHFERYFEFNTEIGSLAELQYVLIYNYSLDDLHFQDCRKYGKKEEIEPQRHKTIYGIQETLDGVALTIEELELFLQFMYVLKGEYDEIMAL